jgi:hypothetical protein
MLMLARIASICVLFAAVLTLTDRAAAQCNVLVTNLAAQSGVCSVSLTWTPHGSPIFTTVRWATSNNYASSTALTTVFGSSSGYVHTSPANGTNFYWVVTSAAIPGCTDVVAGPVSGSAMTIAPVPTAVVGCSSVTISTAPVPAATTYTLYRANYDTSDLTAVTSGPAPQLIDATGVMGRVYLYTIIPSNPSCGVPSGLTAQVDFGGKGAFISQPESTVVNVGQTVTLRAPYVRANAGTAQWYKDNVPLSNGPTVNGVTTSELTIVNAKWGTTGAYTFRIATDCGQISSAPAVVGVRENPCRTDFNDSGAANIDDIFIFLNAWFAGCP